MNGSPSAMGRLLYHYPNIENAFLGPWGRKCADVSVRVGARRVRKGQQFLPGFLFCPGLVRNALVWRSCPEGWWFWSCRPKGYLCLILLERRACSCSTVKDVYTCFFAPYARNNHASNEELPRDIGFTGGSAIMPLLFAFSGKRKEKKGKQNRRFRSFRCTLIKKK